MEGSGFPTDNYMAQGLVEFMGGDYDVRFCEHDDIMAGLDDGVAVACLSEVHYKTGRVLDMAAITRRAHAVGALTVWDLCHSAGAMPVDLNGAEADFAVGCTYKYLNGGPGSPAFLFVAQRHQQIARQPLTGWWGHAAPFAFERDYARGQGIRHFLTSTQPIVSMALAEVGLDIFAAVPLDRLREKSMALTSLFVELVEDQCGGHGFTLASPRNPKERGSQVSFCHAAGYPIMKALIARGVIGDFRSPDIVRFGFTPLYTRYMDVWNAAQILRQIMESGEWRKPAYQQRETVT
jgi:kynureninase